MSAGLVPFSSFTNPSPFSARLLVATTGRYLKQVLAVFLNEFWPGPSVAPSKHASVSSFLGFCPSTMTALTPPAACGVSSTFFFRRAAGGLIRSPYFVIQNLPVPNHLYAPPRGFPTLPRLDRPRPGCNSLGSLARCIRHLGLITYRLTLGYAKTGLFLGLRPFF